MLHLVGLGLADETDVTVKGLEIIRKAEKVYLEAYTSILLVDTAKLVKLPHIESTSYLRNDSHIMIYSRNLIMADPLSWPIVRWSSRLVIRS